MRTDPKFYYPDTPEGRAQYIGDAKALLAEVRARAHEVLDIQPKADVEVRPVEAWREKSAAKAFYSSPPEDDSSPGIFYVNLYDMGAAPKYELAVELYHEAVPGHHVETVVGQEIPGLPRFRKFGSIAAYSEGWGLYAEQLTKEMGLYQDPYSDFGRLALQRHARGASGGRHRHARQEVDARAGDRNSWTTTCRPPTTTTSVRSTVTWSSRARPSPTRSAC